MRRSVLAVIIAALLLAGVGFRVSRMVLADVKTGETQTSPDGRLEASVMDSYAESFWGQPKHWLEFSLTGSGQSQYLKTDYIEGPYFGSRSSYSVIHWADDSSSVSFVFPSAEITLKLQAKP
jgi:hypothetical protein